MVNLHLFFSAQLLDAPSDKWFALRVETRSIDIERRRHARLDLALSVSYAIEGPGGGISEFSETLSNDISAGGLRLMTPHRLENGSILHLEILLEDEESIPIRAVGEVVWQSQISETSFETGAVIKTMEEQDKKRFLQFVFDQMSRIIGGDRTPSRYLH